MTLSHLAKYSMTRSIVRSSATAELVSMRHGLHMVVHMSNMLTGY